MTGKTGTSWNWLHSLALPSLLALTEATWVSLCVSAAANAPHGLRIDLPFLAFALPAVVAALVAGTFARRRWTPVRLAALALVVVVGAALSAGVVAELSAAGSFTTAALHPWTAQGRVASDTAALAWFVSALSWTRGTWLGAVRLTFRHAARSIAVSVAGFVVLFAVLAGDHQRAVRDATPAAGLLFVVFFTTSVAVLALLHERDVEVEARLRAAARPSGAWLSVLAVPLLGVAGLALLVAAVVGPLAPTVGRGVVDAARAVGAALAALGRFIADLFPRSTARHGQPVHPHLTGPSTGNAHQRAASHVGVPVGVSDALVAVVLAAALVAAFLIVRNMVPRLRVKRLAAPVASEVRDSVFSWGHLLSQLWSGLAALFARRRDRRPEVPGEQGGHAPEEDVGDGVRRHYRRMLEGVRRQGHGRVATETPAELERRLAGSVVTGAATTSLRRLTALYEAARYGGADDDELADVAARSSADVVGSLPPDG